MRRWLADHGHTKRQLPVRVFLDCWNLYLQEEGFLIKAPGRLQYFWWAVRKNHVDSRNQTWKFTLLKYLTSISALIFGYAKAGVRDKLQDDTVRLYRTLSGGRSDQAPTNR
jgi:hypothetical protein